jgi:hypothetical protein
MTSVLCRTMTQRIIKMIFKTKHKTEEQYDLNIGVGHIARSINSTTYPIPPIQLNKI